MEFLSRLCIMGKEHERRRGKGVSDGLAFTTV